MSTISKHLIKIELYKISSKLIYNLRSDKFNKNIIFNILPKYTINEKNGTIRLSEDYLQFVGFGEDDYPGEEYLMFNIDIIDPLLDQIIDDIENELKDLNLKYYLSVFNPQTDDDFKNFSSPLVNYMVIEIEHIGSYDPYFGGYDYDFKLKIIGYLDNDMIFKNY